MGVKRLLRGTLSSVLSRYGYEVIERERLHQWQQYAPIERTPRRRNTALPKQAEAYLLPDNPRHLELQARYSMFNREVTTPLVWEDDYVKPDEMLYFRGDNAYVWQLKGANMGPTGYALATYYVKSIDQRRLLDTLKEDEFFGNFAFNIDGTLVSRDLLDSIIEIYFLEKHLGIFSSDRLTILDIGAGYGRLAHRMASALPNIAQYLCTDAFPTSTFLCEYYIGFRKLKDKVKVIPLDEIERDLGLGTVDVSVNIHGFSECRLSAIEWWVSLLAKHAIKYLMVVPNARANGGKSLSTVEGDFGRIIEKYGYALMAKEPKYRDPWVQKYAMNPTYHYLFKLC